MLSVYMRCLSLFLALILALKVSAARDLQADRDWQGFLTKGDGVSDALSDGKQSAIDKVLEYAGSGSGMDRQKSSEDKKHFDWGRIDGLKGLINDDGPKSDQGRLRSRKHSQGSDSNTHGQDGSQDQDFDNTKLRKNTWGEGTKDKDSNTAEPGDATVGDDRVSDTVLRGVLDQHNQYRARHGVPALSWSSSIASQAQSYSQRCVFQHSRSGLGENLAKGHRSFSAAVSDWYSEGDSYSYGGSMASAGHFTAMVWKSTTELGCGYSSCGGSPLYVCNYSPAGNVRGRFQENVLPPKN